MGVWGCSRPVVKTSISTFHSFCINHDLEQVSSSLWVVVVGAPPPQRTMTITPLWSIVGAMAPGVCLNGRDLVWVVESLITVHCFLLAGEDNVTQERNPHSLTYIAFLWISTLEDQGGRSHTFQNSIVPTIPAPKLPRNRAPDGVCLSMVRTQLGQIIISLVCCISRASLGSQQNHGAPIASPFPSAAFMIPFRNWL